MSTTLRVLALLDLLQDRDWVSGPELARRLEVEARMLRRDITRLQEIGVPVESRLGRHGGYRLRPGYRLPPLMLSDEEATAVALALRAAGVIGLGASAPALETSLAKIYRVLPTSLRARLAALETALGFGRMRGSVGPVRSDILLTMAEAIRAERRVWMRYATPGRPERERAIDVFGMAVVTGRWYVVGLDHSSDEERVFRVDRVRAAYLGSEPASVPPGFDAVAFVERSLARVPWRWSIEILAKGGYAEVRAAIPATVAELAETADGVYVRIQTDDLDGAARMLAALPWTFEILAPSELADALRTHARRLLLAADVDPLAFADP